MYFLKRILFAIPLLLVISVIAFMLVHLVPGGPFDRERAPASPEIERKFSERRARHSNLFPYYEMLRDLRKPDAAFERSAWFPNRRPLIADLVRVPRG